VGIVFLLSRVVRLPKTHFKVLGRILQSGHNYPHANRDFSILHSFSQEFLVNIFYKKSFYSDPFLYVFMLFVKISVIETPLCIIRGQVYFARESHILFSLQQKTQQKFSAE